MNAQVWIAILVGLAATINDLARREIANWIPASALVAGLGWQIGQHGWRGALYALAGAAAGFGVFLIFYLLGGMGGGDVKLMAGFGALLGAGRLLEAALWTAGVGGILAVAVVLWRSIRRAASPGRTAPPPAERESIPYAPAITLGVWLSLVPKS
jgi:prepilin peptidase CpaA